MQVNTDLDLYLNANDWNERLRVELPAIDRVVELQRGKGALRILDVGCGPGLHLQALAKRYPKHLLDGIDIDASRVAYARAAAERDGLPITYVAGDFMEHAPFPRPSYDIVYAIGNSIATVDASTVMAVQKTIPAATSRETSSNTRSRINSPTGIAKLVTASATAHTATSPAM